MTVAQQEHQKGQKLADKQEILKERKLALRQALTQLHLQVLRLELRLELKALMIRQNLMNKEV